MLDGFQGLGAQGLQTTREAHKKIKHDSLCTTNDTVEYGHIGLLSQKMSKTTPKTW